MPIDPAVQGWLDAWGDPGDFDLAAGRAAMDAMTTAGSLPAGAPRPAESEVGGVPVRIHEAAGVERRPPLVWCHGGGWVLGSAASVDGLCRFFADRLECRVVSVDYRLAPEHPFPAALDDAVAVLRALGSAGPVAIGGDSAGGGLAAGACLETRHDNLDVRAQVLLNPFLDATLSFRSVDTNGRGCGLTRNALEEFARLYLAGADPADPRCSPVLAESFDGLPPAVIVTAEFDPLRDEAEAYGERLQLAGVEVRARRWDGMIHGFYGLSDVTPAADDALDWTARETRAVLRTSLPPG